MSDTKPSPDSGHEREVSTTNAKKPTPAASSKRKRVRKSEGGIDVKKPKADAVPAIKLNHRLFSYPSSEKKRTRKDIQTEYHEAVDDKVRQDDDDNEDAALEEDGSDFVTRGSIVHKIRLKLGKLDDAMLRDDPYEAALARKTSSSNRGMGNEKKAASIETETHSADEDLGSSPAHNTEMLDDSVEEVSSPLPEEPATARSVVCRSGVLPQFRPSQLRAGRRVIVKDGHHRGRKGVVKLELNAERVVVSSDDGKMWTAKRSQLSPARKAPGFGSVLGSGMSTEGIKSIFLECLDWEIEAQRESSSEDEKPVGRFILSREDAKLLQPFEGRIDGASCTRVWAIRALESIRGEEDEGEEAD